MFRHPNSEKSQTMIPKIDFDRFEVPGPTFDSFSRYKLLLATCLQKTNCIRCVSFFIFEISDQGISKILLKPNWQIRSRLHPDFTMIETQNTNLQYYTIEATNFLREKRLFLNCSEQLKSSTTLPQAWNLLFFSTSEGRHHIQNEQSDT